jgi:peptidoglycan/LPS O-acetylase OafA/YrhL
MNVLTPVRLDGLMTGALIAVGLREGWLKRYAAYATVLFITAGGCAVTAIVLEHNDFGWGAVTQTLGYLLLALSFGALLVLTLDSDRARQLFELRTLTVLGKYSYGLYLFHLPVRAMIRDTVYGPDRFLMVGGSRLPGQILFYFLSTLGALAVAWLSWNLYERHFLSLKSRFTSTRDRPAAVVVGDKMRASGG